jgi:hypothetical protein
MRKISAGMALLICLLANTVFAQQTNSDIDSIYINEIQDKKEPAKVLHAEPLFIDLIRDLGARKGEREWNYGVGITDNLSHDTYQALVEYEFAPLDRLGLEVEVPFTFVAPLKGSGKDDVPSHRMESLKTAIQYTFLVSQRYSTSMAIGYINEIEFTDINKIGTTALLTGNVFNPFFVAAKRWGNNFHTLLYTGPRFEKAFEGSWHKRFDINSNLHYMIPGTRNFIGIEVNKELTSHDFDMVIRPQLRVGITDNLLIGIVAGIPIAREEQRFSSFARIIWEPAHRHN